MQDAGINQDNSKVHNRSLILKLIKKYPGITRRDLSTSTGLSKAAITKIVGPFLSSGIISEESDNPKSRNKGLLFTENRFYVIVIYLGRLSITGGIYDIGGSIIARQKSPSGISFYGNDDLPDHSLALIESLIKKSNIRIDKFLAIGIAAPGAVSAKKGFVFNRSISFNGLAKPVPFNWGKINLVERIEDKTGLPVFIDNNSNLAALAESWFGKGVGVNNFVQYSIGLGIGGGAIINGQLYRGNDNIACEIGHVPIQIDGKPCFCGNRGCLETEAGFKRIVEQYYADQTVIGEDQVIEKLKLFFRQVDRGEDKATFLMESHSKIVAIGAVILINLFNPEKLIISPNDVDGINLDRMVKEIEKYVRRYAYPVVSEKVCIESSELGDDIHLCGAYTSILENLYTLILAKKKSESG